MQKKINANLYGVLWCVKGGPNIGSLIMWSDKTSGTVNSGCPGSQSRKATLGCLGWGQR